MLEMRKAKEINLRKITSSSKRRKSLEKSLSLSLESMGNTLLTDEDVSRNCENFIGAAQVPIGVAGPLTVDGQDYFIPLATSEAGLVASVNRGCKAITSSGGCKVLVERVGMTRGPVFKVATLDEGRKLVSWVGKNEKKLAKVVLQTSSHIRLVKVENASAGDAVFLRFVYDTQDAMGMNMATIATQTLVDLIEKKTGARCVALAGNYDVDKKPSFLNFIRGRGFKAWAQVRIPRRIVKQVLKSTPEAVKEVFEYKVNLGSSLSGSLGRNAHIANVAAAFFIATGQDVAHVSEVSIGTTTVETRGRDLGFGVYLPDLPLGTIGGGTGLPTQREILSMLGVEGGNKGRNSEKLAGIFAGACLAGELSLLASLAEGTLARAHARLAWGGAITRQQ